MQPHAAPKAHLPPEKECTALQSMPGCANDQPQKVFLGEGHFLPFRVRQGAVRSGLCSHYLEQTRHTPVRGGQLSVVGEVEVTSKSK